MNTTSQAPEPPTAARSHRWLPALALALVAVCLWPLLQGGLVYDDMWLVAQNPSLRSFSALFDSWTVPYWAFAQPEGRETASLWRPLSTAALFAAQQLGGGSPTAFHALSLALHLASVAVAFALARRLSQSEWVAFATALIFGLHPVQVEAVAWISAVNDPLAGLFVLLAAKSWLDWRERGSRGLPFAAGIWLLWGLLAKESAVALLCLCPAIDAARALRGSSTALRSIARAYAPLAAACIAYWILRAAVFGGPTAGVDMASAHLDLAPGRELSLRLEMFGSFIGLCFWPSTLDFLRDLRPAIPAWDAELVRACVWSSVWLAAVVAAALQRWTLVFLGLIWIPLAVAPLFVDIELLGRCPISERYLYTAVFGAALVVASALGALRPRALGWAALAAVALAAGWKSRERTRVWHDERALFEATALASPNSPYVLWSLGRVLLDEFRAKPDADTLTHALQAFQRSQALGGAPQGGGPRDESVLVAVEDRLQAGLGVGWSFLLCEMYLADECSPGEAEGVFREIVKAFPDSAEAHVGLGVALARSGAVDEAQRELERASQLNPKSREAWFNLGLVRVYSEDFDSAAQAFEAARAIDPRDVENLLELASALSETGGSGRALALVEEARSIAPAHPRALLLTGILLAKANRFEEALGWVERALQQDGTLGQAHLERAKLLYQLGRIDRAIPAFDKAIALLPASFEAHFLYGRLLAGMGAQAEGLPVLERALQVAKPGAETAEARAEIERLKAELPPGK